MPRPSSKIMNLGEAIKAAGGTPTPTDSARSKALKVVRPLPTTIEGGVPVLQQPEAPVVKASRKAAKVAKQGLSKAEISAKIKDLKAALKLAREPLDKYEGEVKAAVKAHGAVLREYVAVTKKHENYMRGFEKVQAKHQVTVDKYTKVYDKTVAKINADIAKIQGEPA